MANENNMAKQLIYLLIIVSLTACNGLKTTIAEKRIDRILKKYPSLTDKDTSFIVRNDTIRFITASYSHDTIVKFNIDTTFIQSERFITTIIKSGDAYEVKTMIPRDTIFVPKVDTIFTIRERVVTANDRKNTLWIKSMVLILLAVVAALIFYLQSLKNVYRY